MPVINPACGVIHSYSRLLPTRIPGLEQLWFYTDGRSIFNVLYVLSARRNDLIIGRGRPLLCDKSFQKIIRCEIRVVSRNAHSATCQENQ